MATLKKKGSYGCNERGNRWRTHDLPCPGLLIMRLAWLNSMDCSHSRHPGETINDIFIGHHDSDCTKSPAVGNEASLALNYSAKPCEFVLGHRASRRRWTVSARAASAIACLGSSALAKFGYWFRLSATFSAITKPLRPVWHKGLGAARACPLFGAFKTLAHDSNLSLGSVIIGLALTAL